MTSAADSHSATLSIADEADLAQFAARLAAGLPAHAFVALHGDLGAGKTTLVKAVAAAAGINPADVVSPTFGLIHLYDAPAARPPIHIVHADLYRLTVLDDLREIGWDDATAARPNARVWTFVEWPERITDALPADRLDINIAITSETGRRLTIASHGAAHAAIVAALRHHDAV
jgi:tRNA threonylcarbamoyl adenosine modification protein YjeE